LSEASRKQYGGKKLTTDEKEELRKSVEKDSKKYAGWENKTGEERKKILREHESISDVLLEKEGQLEKRKKEGFKIAQDILKLQQMGVEQVQKQIQARSALTQALTGEFDAMMKQMQFANNIDTKGLESQLGAVFSSMDNEIVRINEGLTEIGKTRQQISEGAGLDIFTDMLYNMGKTGEEAKEILDHISNQVNAGQDMNSILQLNLRQQEAILKTKKAQLDVARQEKEIAAALEPYKKKLEYAEAELGVIEASVNIMDTMAVGIGASAQMRFQAVEAAKRQLGFMKEQEASLLQRIKIDKAAGRATFEIERQVLELRKKQLGTTQKMLDMTKSLREGWISAISAMTTGQGRFSKIMVDQNKNLRLGLKYLGMVTSHVSGARGKGSLTSSTRFMYNMGTGGVDIAGSMGQVPYSTDQGFTGGDVRNVQKEITRGNTSGAVDAVVKAAEGQAGGAGRRAMGTAQQKGPHQPAATDPAGRPSGARSADTEARIRKQMGKRMPGGKMPMIQVTSLGPAGTGPQGIGEGGCCDKIVALLTQGNEDRRILITSLGGKGRGGRSTAETRRADVNWGDTSKPQVQKNTKRIEKKKKKENEQQKKKLEETKKEVKKDIKKLKETKPTAPPAPRKDYYAEKKKKEEMKKRGAKKQEQKSLKEEMRIRGEELEKGLASEEKSRQEAAKKWSLKKWQGSDYDESLRNIITEKRLKQHQENVKKTKRAYESQKGGEREEIYKGKAEKAKVKHDEYKKRYDEHIASRTKERDKMIMGGATTIPEKAKLLQETRTKISAEEENQRRLDINKKNNDKFKALFGEYKEQFAEYKSARENRRPAEAAEARMQSANKKLREHINTAMGGDAGILTRAASRRNTIGNQEAIKVMEIFAKSRKADAAKRQEGIDEKLKGDKYDTSSVGLKEKEQALLSSIESDKKKKELAFIKGEQGKQKKAAFRERLRIAAAELKKERGAEDQWVIDASNAEKERENEKKQAQRQVQQAQIKKAKQAMSKVWGLTKQAGSSTMGFLKDKGIIDDGKDRGQIYDKTKGEFRKKTRVDEIAEAKAKQGKQNRYIDGEWVTDKAYKEKQLVKGKQGKQNRYIDGEWVTDKVYKEKQLAKGKEKSPADKKMAQRKLEQNKKIAQRKLAQERERMRKAEEAKKPKLRVDVARKEKDGGFTDTTGPQLSEVRSPTSPAPTPTRSVRGADGININVPITINAELGFLPKLVSSEVEKALTKHFPDKGGLGSAGNST